MASIIEKSKTLQSAFRENYDKFVKSNEKIYSPFVCIGENNGMSIFIRPTHVMWKSSMFAEWEEKPGISYFAYDHETGKRTWGSQCPFIDLEKINKAQLANFNIESFTKNDFGAFDTKVDFELWEKRKEMSSNMKEHFSKITTTEEG